MRTGKTSKNKKLTKRMKKISRKKLITMNINLLQRRKKSKNQSLSKKLKRIMTSRIKAFSLETSNKEIKNKTSFY